MGRRPAPVGVARPSVDRAEHLRILLVEDSKADAALALRELKRGGIVADVSLVQNEAEFRRALEDARPHIILSDYTLPAFSGGRALALARERAPDTPFIFVSGTMGEEQAVGALKNGAADYVLKSNLIRLPAAVTRALEAARDRAARQRAERALRASEAGLRRAQSIAGLAHVISGASGAFESWSDTLPRMLGLGPKAMPRSTREWMELLHPDDRAGFRAEALAAARTASRAEFEYRIRHADGSWIQMRQITEPLESLSVAPGQQRWIGTLLDVTRQKEAERALAASEQRYRATFEQAAVGVVHTSPDGEVRLVNQTFCEMSGYSRIEAIQLHIRDVTHPEDFARSAEGRAQILGEGGTPYQRELRLVRKDGLLVWVNATTSAVRDADGRPVHFVSVLSDISEHKRMEATLRSAEQRYRDIFENSIEGIFVSTPEGRMIDCNPANARFLGYDSPQELIAAVTDAGVQLYANPGDRRRLVELLERDGFVHGFEVAIRRRDGATVWSAISARAVRDSSGAISHVLGMQQDITARVRAERESQRFRAAMDITVDSIYLTDSETMQFLYVNDTACKRLGYPREELMKKASYEIVGKTREEVGREFQAVIDAGEAGSRIESRFLRKDGSEGWTELHRRTLQIDGKPLIVTIGRDITDRKRAALELAESEERFRSLIQLSSDFYWETDAEHRVVRTAHGADGEHPVVDPRQVGKTRWETPSVLPDAAGWAAHRAAMDAHRPFRDFEIARRGKDGVARWRSLSGEPMFDASGAFKGYRGIGKDITASKRGEEDLRRFRLAMDGSADVIFLIDRATMRNVDCNDTACRLLGYSREELLLMGPADILPFTRAELEKAYDEMIATQTATGVQSYYRCKDGSRLPFESTRRLMRSGNSWLVVAVARDIRERLSSENARRESEERFRQTFELAGSGLAHVSLEGRYLRVNPKLCEMFGYTEQELVARSVKDVSHPEDRDATDARRALLRSGEANAVSFEKRYLRKDGSTICVSLTVALARNANGDPAYEIAILEDITERRNQQQRIERLTRVYALLSGINAAIVRTHRRDGLYREACRVAVEDGAFRMAWAGVVESERGRIRPVAWQGADDAYIQSMPLDLDEAATGRPSLAARAVQSRKPVVSNDMAKDRRVALRNQAEQRGFHSLAILPLLEAGQVSGVLALYAPEIGFFDAEEMKLLNELAGDISFALDVIAKEEKLSYLALYDPLTGLANRALMAERLAQSIHGAGHAGAKFAIAWFDVERLTTINESLGRQAGDALIRQVGERLARAAGAASVARITADHFVVVLPTVKGRSEAGRVSANLARACFAEPYLLQGAELKVAAKAGLALFPNDGTDTETLLGNAEAALRKAKETGEHHVFYTSDLTERTGVTLTLENKLRRALEKDEFVLHYQPKIEAESRQIAGMEALIRWQSPELGLVPPGKFIPLMEETGMILDVGTWALRRASLDHARWTGMSLKPPRVAVNVSAIQLRQKEFVSAVEQAIMEGVAPTGIDLEITESLIMEDIEGNIGKLREVRGLGVGIAIDDFGTGYSSLSYLAKLPVQTLKIDRSFVITMLSEPDTMTLVQTIISLAHSLRLKVVAEGVDAEEQAKVLRLLRCDQMQGFLFSKPVPFDELTGLLKGAGVRLP